MGKAVLDMQAKATADVFQIPGGTMHYAFGMQPLALIALNPEPMRLYRDTNYLGHRIHDSLGSWRLEHAAAYTNFNATQAKVTTMDTRLLRRNVPTASVNVSGLTFGGGKGHASSQLFFVMDKPGQ
eukprot:4282606-Pleurochrysis_carterae.AAC.1